MKSTPETGARITLDDDFVGTTNFVGDYLMGEYTLRVMKDGYETYVEKVNIIPTGPNEFKASLRRK